MFESTMTEVSPRVLKELVAAGSVTKAVVKSFPNGLLITLQVGMSERVVGATRGGPRFFQSLDAAASALWQAGIYTFTVDNANGLNKARTRPAESQTTS